MAASLNEIIIELARRTEEGKIHWRKTHNSRRYRASIGDFQVMVEHQDWDEKEHYTVELSYPEDTVIDLARDYDTEGASANLFRRAAQSAVQVEDRRQELMELLQDFD